MSGTTLILVEHDRGQVKHPSLHAINAAQRLGADFALLLLGHGLDETTKSLLNYRASVVVIADDAALAEPLADRYAAVIAQAFKQLNATTLLGTSSTYSKDILPRAAALLDTPMLTDVLAIEEQEAVTTYRRPINAGSTSRWLILCTARSSATACLR